MSCGVAMANSREIHETGKFMDIGEPTYARVFGPSLSTVFIIMMILNALS